MTFLPGKRGHGQHWEHRRDLVADAHHLRTQWGVERMVLLPRIRLAAWAVPDVVVMLRVAGIDVVRHPVVDQGVPADRASFGRCCAPDRRCDRGWRERGRSACVGGLGRTGTTVACLLKDAGLDAGAAIDLTRDSRRGTIDDVQERFVRDW
ncbi:MAG: hypothetical protein R3C32_07455 [Chloroflexota bacterium]